MNNKKEFFNDIGIDSAGFYAPRYFINLEELAIYRNVDPNKYRKGLLLKEMRFPDADEDIISMGLKAGYYALLRAKVQPKEIDALFVATETITYAAKSVSNILADFLEISPNALTQDIYNTCAAGTLALINASSLIESGIINKALVIMADISSYDLKSPGEPTQGAGATAFVISKNPRIAVLSKAYGKISSNINDFYRPANHPNAKVFGQFSIDSYIKLQLEAYDDLSKKTGNFNADFYVLHAPFPKLVIKCMKEIIRKEWKLNNDKPLSTDLNTMAQDLQENDSIMEDINSIVEFNDLRNGLEASNEELKNLIMKLKKRVIPPLKIPFLFGNMYSASLWAQMIYILENYGCNDLIIYFGSYGSGATCISGLLKCVPGCDEQLKITPKIEDFIVNCKQKLEIEKYEKIKSKKNLLPPITLGHIKEHENNKNRGFTFHFCDKGCIISEFKGLDYCPKGHQGNHKIFFPLHAILDSEPISKQGLKDLSYIKDNLVRIDPYSKPGDVLEFELRRIDFENNGANPELNLINWAPYYIRSKCPF